MIPWCHAAPEPAPLMDDGEYRDLLDAAVDLRMADESPGHLSAEQLTEKLKTLSHWMRVDERLRQRWDLREEMLRLLGKFLNDPIAIDIVLAEIHLGTVIVSEEEPTKYVGLPTRLLAMETLLSRLPYIEDAAATDEMVKGFARLRHSLYLASMDETERNLYWQLRQELAALSTDTTLRQLLLSETNFQAPSAHEAANAIDQVRRGHRTADNLMILVAFVNYTEFRDATPQHMNAVFDALSQYHAVDAADIILQEIDRARPGARDNGAIVLELLTAAVYYLSDVRSHEGMGFIENLIGKLLSSLHHDDVALAPSQDKALRVTLERLYQLLPPTAAVEGTNHPFGTYEMLKTILELAQNHDLKYAITYEINHQIDALRNALPNHGAACPAAFLPRMSNTYGINFRNINPK